MRRRRFKAPSTMKVLYEGGDLKGSDLCHVDCLKIDVIALITYTLRLKMIALRMENDI